MVGLTEEMIPALADICDEEETSPSEFCRRLIKRELIRLGRLKRAPRLMEAAE